MKKFLSMALALCMIFALCASSLQASAKDDVIRLGGLAPLTGNYRLADGLCTLVTELLKATGIEGIYMSVGTPNEARCSDEMYRKYITPSDKKVLAAANSLTDNSMMHICGWGGNRNNLRLFADYEVKVFNWATHVENIGLAEGKEIFGGHAVLGGFPSETGSFLYKGMDEAGIKAYTRELIEKNGKLGVMIGADCTMPMDMSFERLGWVREALEKI